MTSSTD
jgi:hypothetical protein